MTQVQDVNALLMGSGGRSAKFEQAGDTIIGLIARVETRQMTEIGSGALRTWPDGNPRMQLVIQLQTDWQTDEEDDGLRNLYVPIPSQMQKAIADAVRKTGEHGLGHNGKLGIKFVRTEKPKTKGYSGQKIYSASYAAPVVSAEDDGLHAADDDDDSPF
jgi:hypothetical protein